MQAADRLRQQNVSATQNLAAQLQSLAAAQAQARSVAAPPMMHQAPLAPPVVFNPPSGAMGSSAVPLRIDLPGGGGPASSDPGTRADAMDAEPEEDKKDETPRCHLHKKVNKACKFCKAWAQAQELEQKKLEEKKAAALERLLTSKGRSGPAYGQDDKAPLPNLKTFPQVLLERIQKNDFFNSVAAKATLAELKDILYDCDSSGGADVESRSQTALDLEPSRFICSVYRLLTFHLTEDELQTFLMSGSPWIRCAGVMYVRFGVHQDRYWELLSPALVDDEDFIPFPSRSTQPISVGRYVEELFDKDRYCNLNLPRIPVAQRRGNSKRLCLYGQFRKRYAANLHHLDRFKKPGVRVEICSVDGNWTEGVVEGTIIEERPGYRVVVRNEDDKEEEISLGMIIVPNEAGRNDPQDLTRTRGRSTQELFAKYQDQQKDSAATSGKDYCKTSGQHSMRAGGVLFVAGGKRKELEQEEDPEEEERLRAAERPSGPSLEHRAKMAAIEQKYLARVPASQSQGKNDREGADRLRFG